MFTNSDMTLYHFHNGAYTKQIIRGVFWDEQGQATVSKQHLLSADKVFILVPAQHVTTLEITKCKDIAVKGACDVVIDNTSQQTQSESLKLLTNFVTIKEFSPKLYGSPSMQHYELIGG